MSDRADLTRLLPRVSPGWRAALAIGLGLLASVVIFAVWALPARELPPLGPSPVATQTWILSTGAEDALADEGGARRIPVQAWHPRGEEPLRGPVVLFVHGNQGRREGYVTWLRELASHGYVVVAADHPPVALQPNFPDRSSPPPATAFRELLASQPDLEELADHEVFQSALAMVRHDVAAILADLPERLGVSVEEVAVAGHSFGGGVALAVCEVDPRCVAAISLDGPPLVRGPDPVLDEPLLVVTAGQSCAGSLAMLCEGQDRVVAAATGPVHHAELPLAGHLDLSDLPLLARPALLRAAFGPGQIGHGPVDAQLRAVAAISLAFLDRYVRGDATRDPDAVVRASEVLVPRDEPDL